MKKHIVFSNYDDRSNPYYGGGGSIAIHETARHLTSDYQVTVVTGRYPHSIDQVIDGVRYRRIGISWGGPHWGQLVFQLILPVYAFKLRYDIWIENFTPPFSTACLQLYTRRPVIGLVHMLTAAEMERKYTLPFTQVEKVGLKTYKYFIVLSPQMKKTIHAYNSQAQFLVTTNGTYIPPMLPQYVRRQKNYALFLGRIDVGQKGLDLLIPAFTAARHNTDMRLIIAGTGSSKEMNALNKLIKKYDKEHAIELVGKVEGSQKTDLLTHAALACVTSRSEAFCLSALEAVAYGVPLICFDIPGLAWLDDRYAVKVKPFSVDDFATALYKLIASPQTRISMSKQGRAAAPRYSWETVAETYKKFIGSIL